MGSVKHSLTGDNRKPTCCGTPERTQRQEVLSYVSAQDERRDVTSLLRCVHCVMKRGRCLVWQGNDMADG